MSNDSDELEAHYLYAHDAPPGGPIPPCGLVSFVLTLRRDGPGPSHPAFSESWAKPDDIFGVRRYKLNDRNFSCVELRRRLNASGDREPESGLDAQPVELRGRSVELMGYLHHRAAAARAHDPGLLRIANIFRFTFASGAIERTDRGLEISKNIGGLFWKICHLFQYCERDQESLLLIPMLDKETFDALLAELSEHEPHWIQSKLPAGEIIFKHHSKSVKLVQVATPAEAERIVFGPSTQKDIERALQGLARTQAPKNKAGRLWIGLVMAGTGLIVGIQSWPRIQAPAPAPPENKMIAEPLETATATVPEGGRPAPPPSPERENVRRESARSTQNTPPWVDGNRDDPDVVPVAKKRLASEKNQ